MPTKNSSSITLFSDGGGEKSSTSAGACILRSVDCGREARIAVYLGGATNNESEICAGLVGFSLLQALFESGDIVVGNNVRWVCDSEYVLKSATEYIHGWQRNGWKTANKLPVKNQGLWRAYLALAAGLTIIPEHVRGHSGHPENEACDSASTWTREHGDEALSNPAEGQLPVVGAGGFSAWRIFDGRPFLSALRSEYPPEPAIFYFKSLFLRINAASLFNAEEHLAQHRSRSTEAKVSMPSKCMSDFRIEALLNDLVMVRDEAASLTGNRARLLAHDISEILKRFADD